MKIATLKFCLELLDKRWSEVHPSRSYHRSDSEKEFCDKEYVKVTTAIAEINAAIDNTEVTLNTITKP